MSYKFLMPDVGEGIAEGEIVRWYVKEGDTIVEDAPLLEVQNDKLLQEIPSPVGGVVGKIHVSEGTVSTVGDLLVEILMDGAKATEVITKTEVKEEPVVVKEEMPVFNESVSKNTIANRILAMPSVRHYAQTKGVDLTQVGATGKRGHIRKADIETYLAGGAPIVEATEVVATVNTPEILAPTVVTEGNTSREAMTSTRKAIAQAMVRSKQNAPHVTIFDEVDVTKLMEHRSAYKEVAAENGAKLTFLPYVVKALVSVARKYPIINASVDDAKQEIVYKNYYNIGFAADTPHGLYVPNIKEADRKSLFNIAKDISELALKATEGKLSGPEMRDGTVTISNIGSAKGLWFTPIINYPEVAILGIGRIDKKPVIMDDNTIGIGNMMALSLSFDHRVIDGVTAQNVVNELKRLLKDPNLLLMEG